MKPGMMDILRRGLVVVDDRAEDTSPFPSFAAAALDFRHSSNASIKSLCDPASSNVPSSKLLGFTFLPASAFSALGFVCTSFPHGINDIGLSSRPSSTAAKN